MRRIIFSLILLIFLISAISAEVVITEQPQEIYNLGDTIEIPVKIKALTDISSTFTINLICSGVETLVYQSDVELSAGEEQALNQIIILNKERVEKPGTCVIKAILGEEVFELTDKFEISDHINLALTSETSETAPEETIIFEGDAIKENGKNAQGFISVKVASDNETIIEKTDTIKNGYFYLNFSFPKETKAGQYLVTINAYENNLAGEETNKGFINYNLKVTQVPTSLEIVFEKVEVEPGTDLKVKTILHDQTGVSIKSNSITTIKNSENEIIEQFEMNTDEYLEFPIAYNEPAAEWKVVAVSNKLTTESPFNIIEKEDIEILLINRTVKIVNTGNVPYCNKSILIKIGNESVNIDACLEVNEEQEYILTAPDGEYQIEIISDGEDKISESVVLTGRAINVKEVSSKSLVRYPFIWIFIIIVLGFVAYLFFKKGYKKSFFGYITKRKRKNYKSLTKDSLLNTKNKAELSLSIKGNKQNVSLVCMKIKGLKELGSKKNESENTLQKIIEAAEEKKASIYENGDNIFFILAPVKTKTFGNEKTAINLAQEIEKILRDYNKLFKEKIEFGIAVNYGTIIAKQEKDVLKFMSMGTLITTAKKIAGISKGEILLSEKINDKLRTKVKTEKQTHGNTNVFSIKEIKDKENHKNFLSNFVKKLEREKQEKKKD